MENNFHDEILALEQNHVYVAVITGDTSVQILLTWERQAIAEASSVTKLLVGLISLYFTFRSSRSSSSPSTSSQAVDEEDMESHEETYESAFQQERSVK